MAGEFGRRIWAVLFENCLEPGAHSLSSNEHNGLLGIGLWVPALYTGMGNYTGISCGIPA
jgi:hypothetical protein